MKILLLALAFVGFASCGKIDRALDMPDKMDQMNQGMKETNESIRLQKLAIALDQLMKKENQEFLSPIPGDMMAPGKLLAETLTAKEATELIYVKLKNVNENTYRDRHPEDDSLAQTSQIQDFERSKLALLYAVEIVSTFLPDDVLNQIIHDQIRLGGRYSETALQILAMRADFYNRVMLKASLLGSKLSTVGGLVMATEYNSKIDMICKLSFAKRIELKITGFMNQDQNDEMSSTLKLDTAVAKANWVMLLDRSQEVQSIGSMGNDQEDNAEVQRQNAVLKDQLSVINNYINSWPAPAVH